MPGAEALARRVVVALFVDIVGFTPMVESADLEDVHERLAGAFAILRAAVERHGGLVEKFVGDAALALFGAQRAHRDDVDRAVEAACEIRDALAAMPEPLHVRAGIELGEVLVDRARVDTARDLMVVGDAVNTAARLQQIATPGEIVLGPAAMTVTTACVAEQPQRALKGKAEPLRTAVVTGSPVRGAGAVPFIGRVEELAALHAMVSVARDARSPCVAVVSGEPGMGKSRLVSRFAEQSAADGVAVRRCSCRPPGEQSAADLLRELIEPDVRGSTGTEAVHQLARAHRERSSAAEAEARDVADLVGMTVGFVGTGVDRSSLLWSGQRARAHVAWRHYLTAVAAQAAVVVVDDAQWLPADVVDLFRTALKNVDRPLLVVLVSWEPLAPDDLFDVASAGVVEVPPLTDTDSWQLLRGLGGTTETAERVLERASGNPLYLESLARHPELVEGTLPLDVRAAVTARLDAMTVELHAVVSAAAVLAPRVDVDLLDSLVDVRVNVRAACAQLRRDRVLVEPAPDSFEFRHQLLASAALSELTKKERRRLHARAADVLRNRGDARVADLARHLDGAGEAADAVAAYRQAVDESMSRLAIREAEQHSSRAVELAADLAAATRAQTSTLRGHVLFACGRLEQAVTAFTRALETAEELPREVRARILAARATAVFWQFRQEDAERDAMAAVDLAGTDAAAIAESRSALALVRSSQGRPAEATELVHVARERAIDAGNPRLGAMAGTIAVLVEHHSGNSVRAAALLPDVARDCRQQGQPGPLTWALFKGGLALAGLGQAGTALRRWNELVELAEQTDSATYLCEVKNCQAHVYRELGDYARADDLDERCLAEARPLDALEAAANAALNLVAAAIIRDDFDGAQARLQDTEPLLDARTFYRWRYRQRFRYYRATILAAEGKTTEAIELAEESLVQGRQAGGGKNVMRPHLQLALLHARDEPAASRDRLVHLAARAENAQLRPIAWRAWAAAALLATKLGEPADGHRAAALRVLAQVSADVPAQQQNSWRRTTAQPLESRDFDVHRLPL